MDTVQTGNERRQPLGMRPGCLAQNVTIFGTANPLLPHFQPLTKSDASNGDIFLRCNCSRTWTVTTKSNKTERFQNSAKIDHAVPTTYDDTWSSRSILEDCHSEGRAPSSRIWFAEK